MATPTITRIPQLDVQFAAGSSYDPVKLQRMVQALTTVISNVNNQNAQIAAIAAEETAGVGKHVFATESGLGPEHTVSGLVPGNVVVALTQTTAAFAALQFAQLAQVDANTFGNPAEGDVITFLNGYWSAEPSNPLELNNPGQNALVMWTSTDGGEDGNYAWAVPDASLILTPGGLSVNQGKIDHANLEGLYYIAGSDTVVANDHPQYALLAAANTWEAQQTFELGLISESDIDLFGNLEQAQAEPEWRIQNTDDSVDEGTWRIHAEPGQLIFSTVSDDGADGENWLSVTRIEEIADQVNVQSNSFTWNGAQLLTTEYVPPLQSNPTFISGITAPGQLALTGADPAIGYGAFGPGIVLQAVGDTPDEGGWHLHVEPGQLIWSTLDDSGSWGENWLSVTRIAELADQVNVQSNSFTWNGETLWNAATVVAGADIYFTVDSSGRNVINAATPGAGGTTQFIESAGWNSSSGALPISLTVPQDIRIPYGCTLQEVSVQTQGPSGSCTITLLTSAFPFVSGTDITGGTSPAITGGTSYDNTALSGWTTVFAQGAMIRATLTANSNFTSVKIYLRFK